MEIRQKAILTSVLVTLLILISCAPAAGPAPQAPQVPAPAPAPQVPVTTGAKPAIQETWEVKWNNVLAGAKKEGKVVMYSSIGAEVRAAWQRAFRARYGIPVEFISGVTAEMGTKILAERRAGLRLGDLANIATIVPTTTLKPAGVIEPLDEVLILPELSDPKLWWGGQMQWVDSTTHMTLVFSKYLIEHVAVNTNLVKTEEMQSFRDLLNPKWKGKILMRDPLKAGGGQKAIAMLGAKIMDWDFIRELAKQDLIITADTRQQMDWIARGKYPITVGYKSSELFDFQKMGLPVAVAHVREGGYTTCGSATINLMKEAPHPNAARLFINWLLTKEGQTVFSQAAGMPSTRLDVSDEGLLYRRPDPKGKYPDGDSEEVVLKIDKDAGTIIKQIFAPLMK